MTDVPDYPPPASLDPASNDAEVASELAKLLVASRVKRRTDVPGDSPIGIDWNKWLDQAARWVDGDETRLRYLVSSLALFAAALVPGVAAKLDVTSAEVLASFKDIDLTLY